MYILTRPISSHLYDSVIFFLALVSGMTHSEVDTKLKPRTTASLTPSVRHVVPGRVVSRTPRPGAVHDLWLRFCSRWKTEDAGLADVDISYGGVLVENAIDRYISKTGRYVGMNLQSTYGTRIHKADGTARAEFDRQVARQRAASAGEEVCFCWDRYDVWWSGVDWEPRERIETNTIA
ncbi:hypothetical protein P168DRAFT_283433 [Aspergillus campestris IBT 28561]|uniref:Uncharacterized protein n=1 Tax=Aspergillus campestris (strain IBT 28561) TaxID=1392248 RepID=A0A2I1CYH2_ASPC2|nr:uncharacterized protein P168DRAFT_283433 [Aspergillus campestris IBT 28561]PKY02677.1 hypothetical protein P168DRAFT_283433 [Aspergillus campestris IBT 28561]